MNQPRGLGPDIGFTVWCERCKAEFEGLIEGDTGGSYLLPGYNEDHGPQRRPCVECGVETDLCHECFMAIGARCIDHYLEEEVTV